MASAIETLLGRIAVERGLLTPAQVGRALDAQAGEAPPPPLGVVLVELRFLTHAQVEELLRVQGEAFARLDPREGETEQAWCFGHLAVRHGLATAEQVNHALRAQGRCTEAGGTRRHLGRILVEQGAMTEADVAEVLRLQGEGLRTLAATPTTAGAVPPPEGGPVSVPAGAPHTPADTTVTIPSDRSPGRPVPSPPGPPLPAARRSFGKYELVQELGRGGMGVVYQAYRPDLKAYFAVKVLLAGADASSEAVERFQREAQAPARLRHPGIVAVHDIGIEAGKAYYAMDYVEGTGLNQVLDDPVRAGLRPAEAVAGARRRRGLAVRDAVRLLREVAEAIDYAHRQGVVHRDLKPANLLLDREGHVRIVDFGLAKLLEPEGAAAGMPLTKTGMVMGTLAYMPPEQAAGAVHEIDARSDVYALGAILYELVTGRPPFTAPTELELLGQVLLQEPLRPRALNPGLPQDAETIVLKALEKERERRYSRAADLAEDLRRFLDGEAISARPASWWRKGRLAVRRHRAAAAVAATLGLTALALATAYAFTPGTLNLSVAPAGARITIGGRAWTAGREPWPISLPAGAYAVSAALADHEPETREVLIERGKAKDLTLRLRHEQGTLEAESEPPGSELEVDGVAYGSRVRNLALDTGRHRVRAWARECFDHEVTVEVRRGETARLFLWLESGTVWMVRGRYGNMESTEPVPDLDGDGAPDLLSKELNELVIRRRSDGRETRSFDVAGSTYFRYCLPDLGAGIGPAVVVAGETRRGIFAACVAPRLPADRARLWRYEGPPQDWTNLLHADLVPVGDRNGDGTPDVAITGRDRTVRVLDGRSGRLLAAWAIPGIATTLVPLAPAAPERLLFGSAPAAIPPWMEPWPPRATGCLRLADGTVEWSADLARDQAAGVEDLDGDGTAEVWVWSPAAVRALDGRTGARRWEWAPSAPHTVADLSGWTDLDGDGVKDALVLVRDGLLQALSGRDGRPLWCVPVPHFSDLSQQGLLERLPGGGLLVRTQEALVALAPRDGKLLWQVPGRIGSVRLMDWDGDGRPEVLIQVLGTGILCLDAAGRQQWLWRPGQEMQPVACLGDLDGDGYAEILVAGGNNLLGVMHGPRKLWSRQTAGDLYATPVVRDFEGDGRLEVVQVGSWDRLPCLACLDGASGRILWRRTEACAPNRGPGVGDLDGDGRPELLLAAGGPRGHTVFAFRARDGVPVWDCPIEEGNVYSLPVAADLDGDGVPDIVFQRWDGQDVLALDGRRRRPLWRHPLGAYAMGGVGTADLDGDGRPDVIAPAMNGCVYALRGTDGASLWQASIDGGGSRASPTLEDLIEDGVPDVLIVSGHGTLWVLDGRTGRAVWKVAGRTSYAPWGRPVVLRTPAGRTLIVVSRGEGGVLALDWQARRPAWQALSDKVAMTTPVICDLDHDGRPELVVGTLDGVVYVLDAWTGRPLWHHKVGEALIEAEPVAADLDGDGILDLVIADHAGVLQVLSGRPTLGARRR